MSALLHVHGLARRFGGVEALAPVDLELAPGEALAITGPNGAGKSTLLACIAGEIAPSSGTVHLDGHDLSALAAHERARRGVARAFQRPALLPDRSALENVALGRLRYAEAGLAALLLGRSAAGAEHAAREAAALSALEQVGLQERARRLVSELSYGEQKRVDLARALVAEPRLLLVDEPCAGAGPAERAVIVAALAAARRAGAALLLVEHDPDVLDALAERRLALGAASSPPLASPPAPAARAEVSPTLAIDRLTVVARTGARVLDEVSLAVAPGEVVSVAGANASGKTTLLGAVTGQRRADGGRITLDGIPILGWPVHQRARAGVALADRGRALFQDLSVQDNLHTAAIGLTRAEARTRQAELLAGLPALADRLGQRVDTLSGGEQQLLAVARAGLARPRLLLADEPTLGLDAAAAAAVRGLLSSLAEAGAAVLITEQAPSGVAHRQLHLVGGRLSAP